MTNTGSWSINNKTVKSLTIGNKEIQTITRVSDGAILYQKTEDGLVLTFTGKQFASSYSSSNKGLIGSDMIIDWGDGTSESITSNTMLPYHTYSTSGTYTIKVTGEITSIGNRCFDNCTGLTSINIPNSVTSIGDICFSSCTNLTSINIPNSVTSIGTSCFTRCNGLTSINIPNSITSIGTSCFGLCNNLIDYQLYWNTPPTSWNNNLMPNNTNSYFTIPNGTTANYVAKGFPSAKLIERNE